MIASDLARFVAVGALAAVDASGHLSFTWIIVLSVLMGLGDGLFYPAFGGMVPLVVEPAAHPVGEQPDRRRPLGQPPGRAGLRGAALRGRGIGGRVRARRRVLPGLRRVALVHPATCGRGGRGGGNGARDLVRRALRRGSALALGDDRALRGRPDASVRASAGPASEADPRALRTGSRRLRAADLAARRRHGGRDARVRTAPAAPPPRRHLVRRLARSTAWRSRVSRYRHGSGWRASSRCCVGSASASASRSGRRC